jgi:hypothetical protein
MAFEQQIATPDSIWVTSSGSIAYQAENGRFGPFRKYSVDSLLDARR